MNTFRPKRRTAFVAGVTFFAAIALCMAVLHRAAQAGQATNKTTGKKAAPATDSAKSATLRPAAIQTLRNIGKAYYEQGKYPESVAQFQKIIATGQALATDHMDLGLGLMQADKLDEALGEMTTARQMDPKLVAADYNLAILYKRESRYPEAEAALKRVIEADPREPAAWLNLGVVYFSENKLQDAMGAYQHLLDMGFGRGQNFYVAALFRMSTALFRLKRNPDAQKYLEMHAKMKDKVPSVSVQTTALEGGKYGAILVPTAPITAAGSKTQAEKVTFADITSRLKINMPAGDGGSGVGSQIGGLGQRGSIVVADYDGDGHPDLFIVSPGRGNHLFHNNGDGSFSDVTEKAGVSGQSLALSATFADYDNSGHPSLFVAGAGGVTLFHNNGNGTFSDVTEKAGLKGKPDEVDSRAILFDADDDGFLDLVASAVGSQAGQAPASHFYRNNGDGTYTDITEASGLAAAKGAMPGAVFADFNNDGYTDLLFFRESGPPMLFINQGEDKFVDRTAEAGPDLAQFAALNAQVADFNHDGNFDLVLWGKDSYSVLLNRGNAKFDAARNLPPLKLGGKSFGTTVDVYGNGFVDLIASDAEGKLHLIANHGGKFEDASFTLPGKTGDSPVRLVPAWLSTPGKLNLLAIDANGKLRAFEKEGPPARWLQVRLTGSKSNMQGVGTIVELKAGNFYEKVMGTGGPVGIYTGDLSKLDVVRVTWPNQVIQNSINVATNKPIDVRESERLSSSCPFLYVWNGHEYVFYTDILGMAPIGELGPDGSWSVPNPREFVHLPDDLKAENGIYKFQITDEMREADFVDQLRMVAVDRPANEEIYSNEIAASQPVTPAIYTVREKRAPISAVDDLGRNVLPEILKADGRYPTGFRRNRILGLADVHSLTLDIGNLPAAGPVSLWLKGWVFWTDSNGSRALMNNSKLQMVMPYLQVRDAKGQWVTVVPDMGLPSGTNRTMRVDLTGKFLSRDHHVRIVTNLCVYWDQIFFSTDDAPIQQARLAPAEMPLLSADFHYRGFSTPVSDPQHIRPDYFEYTKLLSEAPWNPMRGNYTRYGSVETLLNSSDDRMVVMSVGDEITLQYDGRSLPPLRPGWKRSFLLYTAGYAKDGEPNTAFSKVVGPLPFRSMSKYPYESPEHFPDDQEHQEYLREFQTRPGRALIPPMAPALSW